MKQRFECHVCKDEFDSEHDKVRSVVINSPKSEKDIHEYGFVCPKCIELSDHIELGDHK